MIAADAFAAVRLICSTLAYSRVKGRALPYAVLPAAASVSLIVRNWLPAQNNDSQQTVR